MSRTPYVNNMAGQTRGVKELVALAGAHPLSPECDHFYFLRHGQTPRNALRIFQGYDEPLSELGWSRPPWRPRCWRASRSAPS